MPELSPNQKLAELVLGTDLGEYVKVKRSARPKWSWKLIAEQIAIDTGGKVVVTEQSVWAWYAADEKAAAS